MQGKKIMSKSARLIYIIMLCLGVSSMIFFTLLSPYDYVGTDYQTIDYDALLVMRSFWISITVINIGFAFVVKKYKKLLVIIHAVIILFSIIKAILLFLI